MQKLTAFCPAENTDEVVAALQQEPLVSNVVCLPAVEVEASKDLVMAFLHDRAVDAVLAQLRTLRDWEAGALSLITVDMIVRHDLAQVEAAGGPGDEGDIIGWEMVLVRAQQEARLSRQYLIFMACAGMIATLGLIHDLPILIVESGSQPSQEANQQAESQDGDGQQQVQPGSAQEYEDREHHQAQDRRPEWGEGVYAPLLAKGEQHKNGHSHGEHNT